MVLQAHAAHGKWIHALPPEDSRKDAAAFLHPARPENHEPASPGLDEPLQPGGIAEVIGDLDAQRSIRVLEEPANGFQLNRAGNPSAAGAQDYTDSLQGNRRAAFCRAATEGRASMHTAGEPGFGSDRFPVAQRRAGGCP